MTIKSADQLIEEISEVLAESDGEFIADIANRVLSNSVVYNGDSFFEVEDEDEIQRRDEKNGLYGQHIDDCN